MMMVKRMDMQTLRNILITARPQQWVKNFIVYIPLIFAEKIFDLHLLIIVTYGFILFSLASSSIYLFNDVFDIENDRKHVLKAKRPIASGALSPTIALVAGLIVGVCVLVIAFALKPAFGYFLLSYFILNIAYTLWLKHVVILDVMAIAIGFVFRVLAGAAIADVTPSHWLVICTLLLSLFLGFGKRRHELTLLTDDAQEHRHVLIDYSQKFLDQMIAIVTSTTVMAYALYTISEDTVMKFGTKNLLYTIPFVLYGIFRYLYLIHKRDEGGDPSQVIFTDKPLLINVVLWVLCAIGIIYLHIR